MLRATVRWLRSSQGSTKEAVARGGIWLLIGDGMNRLAGSCKLAVLGRLLAPHVFGVMGIATLLSQWLGYFSQTGFDAALIHKREDIRPYLDTAWTVQVLRSVGIAALMYACAPLAARFFSSPESIPVIQASAVPILLYAFQNPAVVYLRKELSFRREVLWRFSGTVVGIAVAIPMAFLQRNVWALVWSIIAARLSDTTLSFWVVPYRPRLRFDWRRARELGRYGKWVFGYNMLSFCELYADSVVVGKFAGASALGYYQVASQFSTVPMGQISNHIYGLLFPAFTRVPDHSRLSQSLLQLVRLMSIALAPVACLVALFREDLVRLVLGPKWLPAAPCLALLFWAGVAKVAAGVAVPLFLAVGKPSLTTRISLYKVLLFAVLAFPLLRAWGPAGAAAAIAIAATVMAGYQLWLVARVLELKPRPLLAAAAAGAPFCLPVLLLWFGSLAAPRLALYAGALLVALLHAAVVLSTAGRLLLRRQASLAHTA